MTKSKLGSQTQMKAHARGHTQTDTYTHTRARANGPQHLQDVFPRSPRAAGRAAGHGNGRGGPPPMEAPLCSIYSQPCNPRPPRPPGLLLPLEEITEQCGRSENGHPAKGPGPGLGRPWALPPGGPTPTSQAPVSVGFPVAWPSSDLLPTFSPSL